MQSDRRTRQGAGTSVVSGTLLTLICLDNHFQTPSQTLLLSRSRDQLLRCPPITAIFFKRVFKLHKSHTSVSSLPRLSLKSLITISLRFALYHFNQPWRQENGEEDCVRLCAHVHVCVYVCVKRALYSGPSSNKLSLEWAGKNPCGLVPSNCNPQHIITIAGSPLHYCSRAGAGGAHNTHTHTHLSFGTISTVLLVFFLTVLILPGQPPIMNPSEKARLS